mgnify:CR=1 FL=1
MGGGGLGRNTHGYRDLEATGMREMQEHEMSLTKTQVGLNQAPGGRLGEDFPIVWLEPMWKTLVPEWEGVGSGEFPLGDRIFSRISAGRRGSNGFWAASEADQD